MFKSLPEYFREHNLSADVRTLMLLRKCMDKGLVNTLGDLFQVLKGLVTTSPREFGPFTTAFYAYFLDVEIKQGEQLESAILRSQTFKDWLKEKGDAFTKEEREDLPGRIDQFINEVHVTSYDIVNMLKGEDILNKDDPSMADDDEQEGEARNHLDQMADYSNIPLDELLKRMEEVAKQQKRRHQGGSHWIGQGGTSPYGNGGAAKDGIRVGGAGGGKMARKVIGDKNFYPVDRKVVLQDGNIDVALAALKGIQEESTELILDIPQTVKTGVKNGGLFLPELKEKKEQKIQIILLIDNGGWSMTPYVRSVTKLFAKMKRRFAHDLQTYYFHNTIYDRVWSDDRRTKTVLLDKVLQHHKNYNLIVIGDADMAPYELDRRSRNFWKILEQRFQRSVWLNPMDERYWPGSITCSVLKQIIPMFSLSPEGIEKAVQHLNRKKK